SADYDDQGNLREFRPASFVMGRAEIDGRPVVLGGGDFTARARPGGGSGGGGGRSKGHEAELMALDLKLPLVRLVDAFGADIRSIEAIGRTYIPANPNWDVAVALMGEVPVVSAALGSVAGLPAAQVAA